MQNSLSNLRDISHAIDNVLETDVWTSKQIMFYEMLQLKVKTYEQKHQNFRSFKCDKEEIIQNIKEQPLFKRCTSTDELLKYVGSMEVVLLTEEQDPHYHYTLKIKMSGIYFIVEYVHHVDATGTEHIRYRVSFSESEKNENNHGYVTYYSSANPKRRHLPEYDKIKQILPDLGRVEIIHLSAELVAYYDVHGMIAKTQIGTMYPISLVDLAEQVS